MACRYRQQMALLKLAATALPLQVLPLPDGVVIGRCDLRQVRLGGRQAATTGLWMHRDAMLCTCSKGCSQQL